MDSRRPTDPLYIHCIAPQRQVDSRSTYYFGIDELPPGSPVLEDRVYEHRAFRYTVIFGLFAIGLAWILFIVLP